MHTKLSTPMVLVLACCPLLVSDGHAADTSVEVGDILAANYLGGSILKIQPATGAQSSLGDFPFPTDLALASNGDLYISEMGGAIKRLTITNGTVAVLNPTGSTIASARGLVLDPGGDLIITASGDRVVRLNPATGTESLIATGINLSLPTGIEFLDESHVVVASWQNSRLVKIRLSDGAQTVIAQGGGALDNPWGLAVSGDSIYSGHYDSKLLNRISASTGTSTGLATLPGFPYGMGLDLEGNIIVGAAASAPGQADMVVRVSPQGQILRTFSGGLIRQIGGIEVSRFKIAPPGANSAPVLDSVADQEVEEGTLLALTVTAADPDSPPQTLTFSLDPAAPSGAVISSTGEFTWTPSETHGPGTYTVPVRVADDGTPPLSATLTFVVTVSEVNARPIPTGLPPQSVNEGSTLSLQLSATDTDIPAQSLTYSFGPGNPEGVAVSASGSFSWSPSEAQGPGNYTVSVVLVDNGVPPLSATNTFSITVQEVNVAPVMGSIPDKTVSVGLPLSFSAFATDSDQPAQSLSFSLDPGSPTGATITPGGLFTWTPTPDQAPTTNSITVRVADDALPALSSTTSFVVVVNPRISISVGDILAVDQVTGAAFRIDTNTGAQQRLGDFTSPTDLALSPEGFLFVSEFGGSVKRLDLTNGTVSVVNPGTTLTEVWGLALGPNGKLYVTSAASESVVEIDPATGAERMLAQTNWLSGPYGIDTLDSGHLAVACLYSGNLVSVSLVDGAQSLIVPENSVSFPWGIKAAGTNLYVASYGGQSLEKINGGTAGTVYPTQPAAPMGIAVESNGNLVFSSTGLLTNEIVRVNPAGTRLGSYTGGFIGEVPAIEISTIQVGLPSNQPPLPASPTIEWPSSCGIKIRVQDLLGTDPDGDPLTLDSVDSVSAQGGSVTLIEGWVAYDPPSAGLTNSDSFNYTVSDGKGGIVAGVVTVIPVPNLAASLNLSWDPVTGGSMRLRGSGIPSRVYQIEYSESLSPPVWHALGSLTADAAGLFEYVDTPPEGSPARFYRTWTACP